MSPASSISPAPSLRRSPALRLALAALAATAPLVLAAQEPPAPPAPRSTATVTAPPAPPQIRTFSLEFPGGTVAQLVEALNRSGDSQLNLIAEKADLGTELPPLMLRNVEGRTLAEALSRLLMQRGLSVIQAGGGGRSADVYVIQRIGGPPQMPAFESFQLAPYLDRLNIDDIVTAIRAAWELDPRHPPEALQLKFHPATKLLLASGTQDAIMVAAKVVSTLERAAPKPAPEPARSAPPPPR